MPSYTINLTEAQDKAFKTIAVSPQEWIENLVFSNCDTAINNIFQSEVERKIAAGETISGSKEDIVLAANIETAAERNERIAAELAARANA